MAEHHRPPASPWLDGRVSVGVSGIEGRGLFARAPVREAELVAELGGRLVDSATLRKLFDVGDSYVDTITVDEDLHLVLPLGSPAGLGNHSCDPNLWWDGPFRLIARRAIAAGEELTNDYAASTTDTEWTMACACGATTCRGTVTGADYRLFGLVAVYQGHVVPAVRAADVHHRL